MAEAPDNRGIDIDAPVLERDGEEVGKVAYVVVRPPHFTVTDVVVRTGELLGRDIVVPIDQIERGHDGSVHLTLSRHELDGLPDYIEAHYEQPTDDWFAVAGGYYPGGATIWPAGTYFPMPTDVEVNAPPGTVGIGEGMDVESRDGKHVGSIDGLETDDSGEVAAFVVKHGHILHHDTTIPVSEVASVDEARVVLKLTEVEVKERFARER